MEERPLRLTQRLRAAALPTGASLPAPRVVVMTRRSTGEDRRLPSVA
jgi:hypothetical protein